MTDPDEDLRYLAQDDRVFRSSRGFAAILLLPLVALTPVVAVVVAAASRQGLPEGRLGLLLVVAAPLLLIFLPIAILLLRGVHTVRLEAEPGGLVLDARGFRRHLRIWARDVTAIRANAWDASGLVPVLRHQTGAVRLLALSDLPELVRLIRSEQPALDAEVGVRKRPTRILAALLAVLGALGMVAAFFLGGDGAGSTAGTAVFLLGLGISLYLLASATGADGPPTRREEGRLPELDDEPGVLIQIGAKRAFMTAGGLLVLVLAVAVSVVVRSWGQPAGRADPIALVVTVAFVLGLVPMLAVAVLQLTRARDGGAGIGVTAGGVWLFGTPGGPALASWEELQRVQATSVLTQPVVRITLTRAARARQPGMWRWATALDRRIGGSDAALSGRALDIDSRALEGWIRRYTDDPSARDELGSGAALRRLAYMEADRRG